MSDNIYIPTGAESAQEGQFLQSLVAGLTTSEARTFGVDKYATQLFTNFAGDFQTLALNAPQNGTTAIGYQGTFFTTYYESDPPNFDLEPLVAGIPYGAGGQNYGGSFGKRWYTAPALFNPVLWASAGPVVFDSRGDYEAFTLTSPINTIPGVPASNPVSATVAPVFYRGNNQLYPINLYVSRWHSGVKIGLRAYNSAGIIQAVPIIQNPPFLPIPSLSRGFPPVINYGSAPDGSYSISPFIPGELSDADLYILNKTQLPPTGPRSYEIISARIDLGTPTAPEIVFSYRNNTATPIQTNLSYFASLTNGPLTDIQLMFSTNLTTWATMRGSGTNPVPAVYRPPFNSNGSEYFARIGTSFQETVLRFSAYGGTPNTAPSRCYIKLVRNLNWPAYGDLLSDFQDVSPIYGIELPVGSYRNIRFSPPDIYQLTGNPEQFFVQAPADFDLLKLRVASYASVNPPPAGFNAPPGGVPLFNSLTLATMPLIGCVITP